MDLGVGVEVSRTREPGFLVLLAGMVDDDGGLGRGVCLSKKVLKISKVENKDTLRACVEIKLLGKNGIELTKVEKSMPRRGCNRSIVCFHVSSHMSVPSLEQRLVGL